MAVLFLTLSLLGMSVERISVLLVVSFIWISAGKHAVP
jgi:hypothetical protein